MISYSAVAVLFAIALIGARHKQGGAYVAAVAVLSAAVVVFVGLVVVKGLRGGIEVRPDGITVRRCWLPNRQVSWDEVLRLDRVRKCHPPWGSRASVWITYVGLLLTDRSVVTTLGVATAQSSIIGKDPPRVKRLLAEAEQQLTDADPRLLGSSNPSPTEIKQLQGRLEEIVRYPEGDE